MAKDSFVCALRFGVSSLDERLVRGDASGKTGFDREWIFQAVRKGYDDS